MITADGNQSDLTKVTESALINVLGIKITILIVLAKTRSEQVMSGQPWKSYAQYCVRNMDDGSCEITICAINGSEQVTFVVTSPGDRWDRSTSSSGSIYT